MENQSQEAIEGIKEAIYPTYSASFEGGKGK